MSDVKRITGSSEGFHFVFARLMAQVAPRHSRLAFYCFLVFHFLFDLSEALAEFVFARSQAPLIPSRADLLALFRLEGEKT